MSDYDSRNIFEKLGTFVPGYAGYEQREGRRRTDKALRAAVARNLSGKKPMIEGLIDRSPHQGSSALVAMLDSVRSHADFAANKILHTEYGNSGFFDIVQVDAKDLDTLYAFDLGIAVRSAAVAKAIEDLNATGATPQALEQILQNLQEIETLMDTRMNVLREVSPHAATHASA
ncbi:MAG: hypothetical protein E4H01_01530 [Lysobacterales bacterium]|nr:MAG: hypothetical protein E4H01_01530 [Xanthomonadales bacterium]